MIQARAIRNEKEIEFFEAGSKITLTEPVKLVLNLNGQTIADYQRVDNDLVITLESNQTVLIGNFFQPETQSALFVEDGEDLVAFSIDLVPVGDSGFEFADASGAVAGSGATAASAATGSTLSLSAVATAVGAGHRSRMHRSMTTQGVAARTKTKTMTTLTVKMMKKLSTSLRMSNHLRTQ